MSTIYFVRHGQSEANFKRIWGGDFPLTETGREQAATVPGKIPVKPDKVVCSMLKRVQQTAQIAYPDVDIEKNPVFNEITFGRLELEPMTKESIEFYHKDPEGFQKFYKGDDRRERALEVIEAAKKYASENENTAIFLSNTLLMSVIAVLQGKTINEVKEYYLENCNVIVCSYDGELHIEDWSSVIMIKL